MALLRTSQPRVRPQRSPLKQSDDPQTPQLDLESDDEPPTKRLRTSRSATTIRTRWIPGGRGGGGRRIDVAVGEPFPITPRATGEHRKARTARKRAETTGRRTAVPRVSTRTTRTRTVGRPRYSTAAAAAAATHSDGYKPREERGWEEYHPDLDLESAFAVIPSEEVDGLVRPRIAGNDSTDYDFPTSPGLKTPTKKRPGRPQRTQSSMLQSLLTPEAPKFVPLPGPNPRERLTLPKPSYRIVEPFEEYDERNAEHVNSNMARVGYTDHDSYERPNHLIRQFEGAADEDLDLLPSLMSSGSNSAVGGNGVGRVEYDMDEQDAKWLEELNNTRSNEGAQPIRSAIFEITMSKIEKEWHSLEKRIPKPNPKAPQTQRPRSSSAAAVNGEPGPGEEPDSKCAICDDGDCENSNAIVFCDGCDLAVHQECYGVPYIPEGQWLCRKCQLVGNARPSCIFCPNEGGAFKQTNNSKWAHLLCANWIPEVTIGNPSLMEPITDVEKVPNSRWKLGCYVCKQDMGASIQCSDGRCYEPFHLTCARQAGLYLKMKLGGGQNTLMDPTQLRAYCHKHSPADWKLEHRTDRAFEKAVKYFRHHFYGQIWADSKSSALAITDAHDSYSGERSLSRLTLTNKKGQRPKNIWRLPSGAPVVPEVVLKNIEEALTRYQVAKKKEFVAEMCKYWTLKREARRGAALLKRLQLQMETFSSFEVTRRDYKAQGAAGRARLDRRIELAHILAHDLTKLKDIIAAIKQREEAKLEEAQLLHNMVTTVYLPLSAIVEPILTAAISMDRTHHFARAMDRVRARTDDNYYSSVAEFVADFNAALAAKNDSLSRGQTKELQNVAERIVATARPLIEIATTQEADLLGRVHDHENGDTNGIVFDHSNHLTVDGGHSITPPNPQDVLMSSVEEDANPPGSNPSTNGAGCQSPTHNKPLSGHVTVAENTPPASTNGQQKMDRMGDVAHSNKVVQPPTPPISTKGANHSVFSHGGIAFWAEQYDPVGTVLSEQKWDGLDILRNLSVEMSDIPDSDLQEMALEEDAATPNATKSHSKAKASKANVSKKKRKSAPRSRR